MATKARIPGNAKIEYTADQTGVTVTVGTGGAAIGATTVPVTALSAALPSGTVLSFGGSKVAVLTAAAAAAAVSLTVQALPVALVAGDIALYFLFVKISEATSIGIPTPTAAKLEASNLDSVNFNQENISGWTDNGDIAVEANWVGDTSQTALFSYFDARTDLGWRLTVANRTTGDITGFVYNWRGGLLRCALSPIDPKGLIKFMLTANCNGPTRGSAPAV